MHLSASRPNYDNISQHRRSQINTLRIFNDNVSEVHPNIEYRVDFISNGHPLQLIIFLPPGFPKDKPVIMIDNRTVKSHPWMRDDGHIVGAPGLISYGIHSDLGRVVQAIRRELEKNPPIFKDQQGQTNGTAYPPQPQPPVLIQKSQQPFPVVNHRTSWTIPELDELTVDQLKEHESNPDELKHFIREKQIVSKSFSTFEQTLSDLRRAIETLITERRKLSDAIEMRHASILQDFDVYNGVRQKVGDSIVAIKEHRQRFSVENLSTLMQRSSVADDDASDKCAEQFLAGQISVESFLDKYLEVRSGYHKKKVAAESCRGKK